MPICTFIDSAEFRESQNPIKVAVFPSGTSAIEFSSIVSVAFPLVRIEGESKDPLDIVASPTPIENFNIYDADDQTREDIRGFLNLLCRSITIQDQLDESHALAPHQIPDSQGKLQRSRIGDLLHRSKDYSRRSAYKDAAAVKQLKQHLADFVTRHPRYRLVHGIVPAPSSDPFRVTTLVTTLAKSLANSTGKSLIVPNRHKAVAPMKEFEEAEEGLSREGEQRSSIRMPQDLRQKDLIVIDDLYKTGGTIDEVARACRAAGAESVIGLAVTKTPSKAHGRDLSKWSPG